MLGMLNDLLSNRELGQLPLSIGTSLAIESLLGMSMENEDLPGDRVNKSLSGGAPPVFEYEELWINLRTLARNALGALNSEEKHKVSKSDLSSALIGEMSVITTEVKMANPNIRVIFYASDMNLKKYTRARLRVARTENQIKTEKLVSDGLGMIFGHFKREPTDQFILQHVSLKIDVKGKTKAVIITHYPIDLTVWNSFKELTLLESHTGAFKKRDLWYTKYLNGKELTRLPFNEKLLQIFGDKETFAPLDKKWRDDILAVAEKYKWTPLTTSDKVGYGIRSMKNQYLIDWYFAM